MAKNRSVENHLSCSICLNIFKVPRTLPCLHSFCEECLQNYISITSKPGNYFVCPLCRSNTYPVNVSKDRNEWAKDFPLDHIIMSLLEETSVRAKQTSTRDLNHATMKCHPCSLDGNQVAVYGFCTECIEYLCRDCHKDHKKFKKTHLHTVLIGKDLPLDISVFERIANISYCSTHPKQILQFKCINHEVFVCSICAITNHRGNDHLVHIDQLKVNCKDGFKEQIDAIISLKEDAKGIACTKVEQVERVKNDSLSLKTPLCILSDKLKSTVQYLEDTFLVKLNTRVECELSSLSQTILECTDLIDALDSVLVFAQTLLKHGTEQQMIIHYEKLPAQKEKTLQNIAALQKKLAEISLKECLQEDVKTLKAHMQESIDITAKVLYAFQTVPSNFKKSGLSTFSNLPKHGDMHRRYEDDCIWFADNTNEKGIRYQRLVLGNTGGLFDVCGSSKVFQHKCVGTAALSKRDKCMGTVSLVKQYKHKCSQTTLKPTKTMKHVCVETLVMQNPLIDKCVGTTAVPKQDRCVGTVSVVNTCAHKSMKTSPSPDRILKSPYEETRKTLRGTQINNASLQTECVNIKSTLNRCPMARRGLFIGTGEETTIMGVSKPTLCLSHQTNIANKKVTRDVKEKCVGTDEGSPTQSVTALKHCTNEDMLFRQFIVDTVDYLENNKLKSNFTREDLIIVCTLLPILIFESIANPELLDNIITSLYWFMGLLFFTLVLILYIIRGQILNWIRTKLSMAILLIRVRECILKAVVTVLFFAALCFIALIASDALTVLEAIIPMGFLCILAWTQG